MEYYQLTLSNTSFLSEWCGLISSGDETTDFYFINDNRIFINDYIIKTVDNKFQICNKDIFEREYLKLT
jgi:hypothetical protein